MCSEGYRPVVGLSVRLCADAYSGTTGHGWAHDPNKRLTFLLISNFLTRRDHLEINFSGCLVFPCMFLLLERVKVAGNIVWYGASKLFPP